LITGGYETALRRPESGSMASISSPGVIILAQTFVPA
jgi:hypothetical protein